MNAIQSMLTSYENWMERHPTQALVTHVGIYLGISAAIIGIGFTLSQ